METDATEAGPSTTREPVTGDEEEGGDDASKDKKKKSESIQCFPQRAALLKSMLNFLKKAIPDPAFSDSIRHGKLIAMPEEWGFVQITNVCELFTQIYVKYRRKVEKMHATHW